MSAYFLKHHQVLYWFQLNNTHSKCDFISEKAFTNRYVQQSPFKLNYFQEG